MSSSGPLDDVNLRFMDIDLCFKSIIYSAVKKTRMKTFGITHHHTLHLKSLPSLLAMFLLVFGLFGGIMLSPLAHSSSSPTINAPRVRADGIVSTSVPSSTSDDTDYETTCPGGLSGCTVPSSAASSWGATIFSVTYTGTVVITITDCCYEGDYYSLWMTTDPAGLTGWTLVGTTDQVNTGSELAAPTYDSYWTGTGTAYSSTAFNVPVSGTTLFAVRDVLFATMVTLLGPSCSGADVVYDGCSATGISASSEWSPAGFGISFGAGGAAGCLTSGATSWPTVTFTDSSTADISVTGGVLSTIGTCASMTIEDLFTSNPITTTPPVSSPNFYDLSITGLSAGTATVCFTTSLASASTGMWYWNGESWVSATSITYSAGQLCGDIPVTALDTPSTPIVIGTSVGPTPSGVPQFGAPAAAVVAVSLLAFAMLSRRMRPDLQTKS